MKPSTPIDISRSRLAGLLAISSAKCSVAADRLHAAALRGFDKLGIVVLDEAPGGKGAAGDAPQQKTVHIVGMTQRRQQSQPAARRAAADERGPRIQLQ